MSVVKSKYTIEVVFLLVSTFFDVDLNKVLQVQNYFTVDQITSSHVSRYRPIN